MCRLSTVKLQKDYASPKAPTSVYTPNTYAGTVPSALTPAKFYPEAYVFLIPIKALVPTINEFYCVQSDHSLPILLVPT